MALTCCSMNAKQLYSELPFLSWLDFLCRSSNDPGLKSECIWPSVETHFFPKTLPKNSNGTVDIEDTLTSRVLVVWMLTWSIPNLQGTPQESQRSNSNVKLHHGSTSGCCKNTDLPWGPFPMFSYALLSSECPLLCWFSCSIRSPNLLYKLAIPEFGLTLNNWTLGSGRVGLDLEQPTSSVTN